MSVTRIIYDVTEAIANLKKLDRQTGKTGKKTKKDFDEGSKGLKTFNDTLGKISPRAGDAAKSITNLTSRMGPLAGSFAIIGGAVAGVIAELIPYNELMKDAAKNAEDFIRISKQATEARNIAADIASASTFAQLEGKSLDARAERSRITQTQIQVSAEIESSRLRLAEVDKFNRSVEQKLRASVRRQNEIKRELGDSTAQDAISQATQGTTAGRGVLNLASRAEEEALKGNTKLAKELTEEARDRAKELGNHVLFTNAIKDAEDEIKKNLEARLEREKNITAELERQKAAADKLKEEETQRLSGFQQRQAQLTRDKAALESVENDINRAKELDTASTKATQALNDWTAALRNSEQAIDVVADPDARTQRGFFVDRLKALAPGGKTQRDVQAENRAVTQLGENLRALRDQLQRDPASAQQVAEGVGTQLDFLRRLRSEADGGQLSATATEQAKNFEKAAQQLLEAAKARQRSVEAGKGVEGDPETVGRIIGDRAAEAFDRAMGRGISQTQLPDVANPQSPDFNQGASAPVPVEATFNIQGGMLDDETMKQIEDRMRRLLREEKSQGIA